MLHLIDSHCHLADEAFVTDLEAVVERARAAGLATALCILSADEGDELARVETVAACWPEVKFAAAIHPHRAGAYQGRVDEAVAATRRAASASNAVASGELARGYHY